jgi:hypothetical protein
VPDPTASTFASRLRRPAPEPEPPAIERPGGGGWRLWSLVLVSLAFALFGAVVWLAYQDSSLAPPVGEPPLIKAASEPIKRPPDETEETTLGAEDGTVGRLWSDAEQTDQPERLLPTPEAPMSPPVVEEPATAAGTIEPPASADRAVQAGGAQETDGGAAALPAPPAGATPSSAAPAPGEESWQQAEVALDRLLAEVTAMSEDTGAPAATAAAPAETPARIEPPAQRQEGPAPAPAPAETAATPADAVATPAPAARAPVPLPRVRPATPPGAPASTPAPQRESTEVAAVRAPEAPPRVPIAADGDFRIQLAAVRGEADARRAWQLFMGDLGPVLADVEPIFERADTANGVFYRVQVGPFASQEAAETLCEQLKQRNASCFVIRR